MRKLGCIKSDGYENPLEKVPIKLTRRIGILSFGQ